MPSVVVAGDHNERTSPSGCQSLLRLMLGYLLNVLCRSFVSLGSVYASNNNNRSGSSSHKSNRLLQWQETASDAAASASQCNGKCNGFQACACLVFAVQRTCSHNEAIRRLIMRASQLSLAALPPLL